MTPDTARPAPYLFARHITKFGGDEPVNAKLKTADMTLIAMFAAILAICAWITIPAAVPVTFQTFGVFLAVGVLGGRNGTLSVLTYLCLGAVGMPVFSGFTGGVGRIAGATGGYIWGFLFSALVMWGMERLFGRGPKVLGISMVLGLLVCYALGTAWYMLVYAYSTGPMGVGTALVTCVLPYIVPDAIKLSLAFVLSKRLLKARKH